MRRFKWRYRNVAMMFEKQFVFWETKGNVRSLRRDGMKCTNLLEGNICRSTGNSNEALCGNAYFSTTTTAAATNCFQRICSFVHFYFILTKLISTN
eukprot:m.129162 g.129162  ORF g.129162 m.129162 type:complete len:96 (+) comp13041_c0_seq2:226-513(+)